MKPSHFLVLIAGTVLLSPVPTGAQDRPSQKVSPRSTTIRPANIVQDKPIISRRLPPEMVAGIKAALERENTPYRNAQKLLREGNLTAAEAECHKAIAAIVKFHRRPWDKRSIRLLGEIYLAQGRTQEALLEFLNSHNPRGPQTDFPLSLAYCRLGDYERAKRYFSDRYILESNSLLTPSDLPGMQDIKSLQASNHLARGMILASKGDAREAVKEFAVAEQLAPKNPAIAVLYALSLSFINRREEAIPRYAIATTYGSSNVKKRCEPFLR
jgi:tetratricopeptide (TPR) repeat protein